MSSIWVLADRYLCARACVNVTLFADVDVVVSVTGGNEPCKVRGELLCLISFLFVCFSFDLRLLPCNTCPRTK